MSGIYIPGLSMPQNGETITITICDDGIVFEEWKEPGSVFKATPVPAHGRLIDADSKTFPTLHRNPSNNYMKGWNTCLRSVQQQPTIIEAEEE